MIETLKKIPKHAVYRPYRYYLFNRYPQTDAYRKLMRFRISVFGSKQAVGMYSEQVGKLQFEYLVSEGMQPGDTLLDIGCGSLKGGKHFIEYLNESGYLGMDISEKAIQSGIEANQSLIEDNRPRFFVNSDLQFQEIPIEVDYALAQSVFTHLPLEQVDECLSNIQSVLTDSGRLYATVFDDYTPRVENSKDHYHSLNSLQRIADENSMNMEIKAKEEYPHPQNQRMLLFKQ